MLIIVIMKIFCLLELLGMCMKSTKIVAYLGLTDILNLQICGRIKGFATEKTYLFENFRKGCGCE